MLLSRFAASMLTLRMLPWPKRSRYRTTPAAVIATIGAPTAITSSSAAGRTLAIRTNAQHVRASPSGTAMNRLACTVRAISTPAHAEATIRVRREPGVRSNGNAAAR